MMGFFSISNIYDGGLVDLFLRNTRCVPKHCILPLECGFIQRGNTSAHKAKPGAICISNHSPALAEELWCSSSLCSYSLRLWQLKHKGEGKVEAAVTQTGSWTPLNPLSLLIQNEHFVGKHGDERQKEDKHRLMHPTN